ncbi:MAG: PAS domain S-box protein [Planctomycetes bacterium]|nr:PAS domain S-box protein [Planctomycetota bacterium]
MDRPIDAAIANGDQRWFRAVADYTYDWESWHRPDGRLIWVNPAVERITGYSVAECLAMPDYPLPLVAPDDRPSVIAILAAARDQTSGVSPDFRCLIRSGQARWMSLAWQPMYETEGGHLGYRTSVRDVTERRILREQLRLHAEHLEQLVQERTARVRQLEQRQRQMEKLVALGQLAAGVAHEINNPLAGMRNAFELIKSTLPSEHEHYELLELIDKEIERISGITHKMYQLYKRAPQRPDEFSFTQCVQEVIFMLANTSDQRQVPLNFAPYQDPVRVTLVEGEVKQILYNLIRNAIQASPRGETVDVRLDHDAKEIAVHVQDYGPGIPDAIMPRIFDPFFSTKQAESQAGMGLGLSVSRSLIEAMGGRIEVSSTPGRGSLFTAIFPWRVDPIQEEIDE